MAKYESPSFLRRTVAGLIDCAQWIAIAHILTRIPSVAPAAMPTTGYGFIDDLSLFLSRSDETLVLYLAVTIGLGLTMSVALRYALGGSIGERVTDLTLLTRQGHQPAMHHALAHAAANLLGVLLCLTGYAWALIDRENQGLGERLSGTRLLRRYLD